ncbi:MAG: type II secretion system protein GspK [Oligoflexia bacterium]|nr:type II secretion system protein GspK [Oligoflexia bacterium]
MKKQAPLKNQKGIAMLITLFSIMIMTFLAVEISYSTRVELLVGASQVDRLRAYYLAKSGVQFSLLRISVYKTVMAKYGEQLGANKSQLDMIWQFPFAWPPMLPGDASTFDKDEIQSTIKKSYIDGAFATSIEGEGAKIDINDLGSPSEKLRQSVNAQLVQILKNRLEADDDWAKDNRDIRPQEIINNIADWIDEDNVGLSGGDEQSGYNSNDPPIKPANRSLKTIAELHMVKGITDELYNIIAPRVTVYGTKGINVNLASQEVLMSIDPQINAERAKLIIGRRNDPQIGGPFQSEDDLKSFLSSKGVIPATFNQSPVIPLIFDAEYNFRIKSTGIYRRAQREIIAIVYDFDKVKGGLASQLATPTPSPSPGNTGAGATPTPTPSPSPGQQGSSGPPQIIFWQEF